MYIRFVQRLIIGASLLIHTITDSMIDIVMNIPSVGDIVVIVEDEEQLNDLKHYFTFIPNAITINKIVITQNTTLLDVVDT